jgi:predicted ATPase
MNRFILLSGCSGGGKSTLLAELAQRGFATIEEPGRRVVREELASGGDALPWIEVDPQTYEVRADGKLLMCEPVKKVPLMRRYMLR